MAKKIKVLVVDDSALVRNAMSEVLSSDPEIQVMAMASDPFNAAAKMRQEVPDVITLDVEMPRMDGITFLKKIMSQHPIPVVICSTLAGEGTRTALKALEYGAVDIIEKPSLGTRKFFEESKIRICDAVKAAAMANTKRLSRPVKVAPKLTADAIMPGPSTRAMVETTEKIIVVGASTGGTEALKVLFEALPLDSPGLVVVQHMPENFTKAFAKRLDGLCRVSVREAENNDTVLRGQVLIAPGNSHLLLKRSGARYYVETREGPLVSRHRPSVDVLFRSAARYAGNNALAVIMTGMGDDGARGMLEMKQAGAFTIAQDENSCVVFGMPKEAIKRKAVDRVAPLEKIAPILLQKMQDPVNRYKPLVTIGIGEYYAGSQPKVIYTLLGSCVAVCLFDPENQIGGMNHILMPGEPGMDKFDLSARYGINAMELLINAMMKLGANRKKVIAKAFGGANVLPSISNGISMGKKNIQFVQEFLKAEKIRIISRDFGGHDTRKIYFHTDTGEVFLKRISSQKSIFKAERKKLERMKGRLDKPGDVTIFSP